MNCKYENKKFAQGFSHIIGCDEVGRACLAGPVVAGAVMLDPQKLSKKIKGKTWYTRVRDSKMVLPHIREDLSPLIKSHALAFGIGVVSEKVIDEINIHHASLLAMRQAVENLMMSLYGVILRPASEILKSAEESQNKEILRFAQDDAKRTILVIDGIFKIPRVELEQETVVDGDAKILSVAAASIIAKVYRDNLMRELHKKYPIYNLAQHKGYPTLHHRKMIKENGLSEIHRLSFCKEFVKQSR